MLSCAAAKGSGRCIPWCAWTPLQATGTIIPYVLHSTILLTGEYHHQSANISRSLVYNHTCHTIATCTPIAQSPPAVPAQTLQSHALTVVESPRGIDHARIVRRSRAVIAVISPPRYRNLELYSPQWLMGEEY